MGKSQNGLVWGRRDLFQVEARIEEDERYIRERMKKENFKDILLYNRIKLVYLRDFYKNLNCFKTTIITIVIILVVKLLFGISSKM